MAKARAQSRGRAPVGSKPAKLSSYFVDEDHSEEVEPSYSLYTNCTCDLDHHVSREEDDPEDGLPMGQKEVVLVDGAPCVIHDYCCRKCHYESIERDTKPACVCEKLMRLSGRISKSDFERRKQRNTPFLEEGERCHHGICCVGCHFKLVHEERREELRVSRLEERRERDRLMEEHRLFRKAQRDARQKKRKREADMAEEMEGEARVRLERRIEEWRAPVDTETDGRTMAELSREAPLCSAGRSKSKAMSSKKGTETVDRNPAELSRGLPSRSIGKTTSKATALRKDRKDTAGVQKTTSVRTPKSRATTGYDHRTIARDILRAAGIHPTLPPLNAHVMQRPETR